MLLVVGALHLLEELPDNDKLALPGDDGAAPARVRTDQLHVTDPVEDEVLSHEEETASVSPTDAESSLPTLEFEDEIKTALEEAFPLVVDRLRRKHFADWHRSNGLLDDLTSEATLAVLKRCRRARHIPNNLVGYLVTTAEHLAIADWKKRRLAPAYFADLERLPRKKSRNYTGRIDIVADRAGPENGQAKYSQEDDVATLENADDTSTEALADDAGNVRVDQRPEDFVLAENAEAGASDREMSLRVRAALDSLPGRQREAIELYMREKDWSTYEQMGRTMGISADGFEKNLERAMKKLRQVLA